MLRELIKQKLFCVVHADMRDRKTKIFPVNTEHFVCMMICQEQTTLIIHKLSGTSGQTFT